VNSPGRQTIHLSELAGRFNRIHVDRLDRARRATFRFEHAEKLPTTLRENIASSKDRGGLPPQLDILD